MGLPVVDKTVLSQYLVVNWDIILEAIALNVEMNGNDVDKQIYEELKKYKLLHATFEKYDEKLKDR